MSDDERKARAKTWFETLRDQICAEFERLVGGNDCGDLKKHDSGCLVMASGTLAGRLWVAVACGESQGPSQIQSKL